MSKPNPRLCRVKAVAVVRRGVFVLRWIDADGAPREESSGVPIGATPRDRKRQRGIAERAAQEKEESLRVAAEQEAAALEASAVRTLESWLESHEDRSRAAGLSDKHLRQTTRQIRATFKACGFKHVADLDADKIARFFNSLKGANRSNRTVNSYRESLACFFAYLVGKKALTTNPALELSAMPAETDRRRRRRALNDEEFAKLVKSAHEGPTLDHVPGPERAMLYIVAAMTGYRAAELASITRRSFNLDSDPPTLDVAAADSKHRADDKIPLHPSLVPMLRAWLPPSLADAPLFNLTWGRGTLKRTGLWVKLDLERAGVAVTDDRGRVADFHSLRYTFISNLARAGVSLVQAQRLARHSTPTLTANIYTDLGLSDDATAVSRLPSPPQVDPNASPAPPTIRFPRSQSEAG